MSSQSQIAANRLNAQKSTGPRTAHGKALASKNSLKHGLSAHRDVITTESQEEFDRHRDALLAELNPQTPMESMLTDRIVSLSWRLKRADLIQNQTIDVLAQKDAANPLAKIAKSLGLKSLGLLQPDPADSNPDLILGRIAIKDFSNERILDRLLMYERRIEHSLYRTILELQRLRLLRNLESPHPTRLAPGPVPGVTTEQSTTPQTGPNRYPPSSSKNRVSSIQHPASTIITQNEPNSQNPETAATNCATKAYNNIPLHPPQENEPNLVAAQPLAKPDRTQLIAAKPPAKPEQTKFPRYDIRHPTSDIRTNDPAAARHKDHTQAPAKPDRAVRAATSPVFSDGTSLAGEMSKAGGEIGRKRRRDVLKIVKNVSFLC